METIGQATPLWMTEFSSFTPVHLVTAGILAAFMVGASWLGRRWAVMSPGAERRLRAVWAWSIVVFQIYAVVWFAWPSRFDVAESLPLHICDLAVWLAPLALLTQNRLARTMLYFWGIGLSTQAFFTPVLEHGVGHMKFWLFWIGHTQIIGSAFYDVAVLHYRPNIRDLRNAILLSVGYAALLLAINIPLGLNYGYVGETKPDRPTLIDKLGEWPLRVLYLAAIVITTFVIVWAPWALWSMRRRSDSPPPAPPSVDQAN